MARNGKKRAGRSSDAAEVKRPRTHDWEKDDEEVDLEAKLFGASKVKKGKGKAKVAFEEEDHTLGQLDDDDVRYCRVEVEDGTLMHSCLRSMRRCMTCPRRMRTRMRMG
jgi:hypothetical protein